MEFETAQNTTTAKLPILKLGEYEMWEMRIKQYFQVQDYALWEVIENGNSWVSVPVTSQENGTSVTKMTVPVTAEEKICKKNDVKARSLLLMALPNEHQLTFSQYTDAKTMFAAIETRFGGNEATKKTQKALLKQQYENFNASSSYCLDEQVGASTGIQNLAFMTASSTSSTNNVNTTNPEVSTVSTNVNTASTENSTANLSDATVYAFLENQPKGSQLVHEDLEQIHDDDLEEMDLKRECRAPRNKDGQYRYQDNSRNQESSKRTVNVEDTSSKAMLAIDGIGFDWSDMAEEQVQTNMALMAFSDSEVYNDKSCSKTCLKNYETLKKQCDDLIVKLNDTEFKAATYKRGLATIEDQLVTYKKNEVLFSEEIVVLKREVGCKEYELGVLKNEFEKVKQEKEGIDFKITKFDNASKDLDKLLESQRSDKNKQGLGYHAVAPPHPLIYNGPTKLDLSYSGLDEFKEPEVNGYGPRDTVLESTKDCFKDSVESSPNVVKETVFHTAKKVEFVKPKNNEKPVKKTVRYAEMYRSQSPRGNQRNWNGQKSNQLGSEFMMYNKACFICGSFNHLQNNCTYHQKKKVVSGNNYNRVDYDYYAKTSHPRTHKNMTPRAVLLTSGLKPLSTARPIYTDYSKPTVHSVGLRTYFHKQAQSTVQRPFYKKPALTNRSMLLSPQHVGFGDLPDLMVHHLFSTYITTLIHEADLSNPQMNDKGFIDSGCSRHTTNNIAYLTDFKEFNGGYVTFGGGAYGGRITGKVPVITEEKIQNKNDVKARSMLLIELPNEHLLTFSQYKDVNTKNAKTLFEAIKARFGVLQSSSLSTASTIDNTARLNDATIYAFLANQPNGSQVVHEDLEQIHEDDLEEMDLKWQLALLKCFNCHKMGQFAREWRNPRSQENRSRNQDNSRRTVNVEESSSKAMLAIDGVGFDWSFMTEDFEDIKSQYDNLRIELNKSEFDLANYKRGLASLKEQLVFYKKNEGLFAPPTIDLSNLGLKEFQQSEFEYGVKANKSDSENSSNETKKTSDALIIEEWVSDIDEDESEFRKIENVQTKPKQANEPRKISEIPRNNNCDFHDKRMVQKPVLNNVIKGTGQREVRPVWNNALRTNHQNFSNSRSNFAPTAVLTKSGLVPISTARQSSSIAAAIVSTVRSIKTAALKPFVNVVNSVNTAKGKRVTSDVGEQGINTVKSKACWVWRPKLKVLDHVSKTSGSYICLELKDKKEFAIPGQTTTGKEFSNPLMAGSLPKTILPPKLLE
ncbi:hypothetical protein Tco_1062480 [Tanacetum coccineum]